MEMVSAAFNSIIVVISGGLFLFCTLILPLILGVRNWYFTFTYPKLTEIQRIAHRYNKVSVVKNDIVIIILGAICSIILINIIPTTPTGFEPAHDYYEACYVGQYHLFLHSEYDITVWVTLLAGFIGIIAISLSKADKIPPIPQALCFAFTSIGEVVFFFFIVQISYNYSIGVIPLFYYLVNLIMLTARNTKRYITEHLRYKEEHETVYIHESAEPLEKALKKAARLTGLHFVMILPAALVLIVLYILLGQGPDGIIKAFTMTADWTFSTQIPPPPIDYEGHYLCTVAAGGHKKVVKPVRYGKRRGETIVVNRQLLASNAFEDMIMERTPKFHKAVRSFYDKHGYPISRHITTQTRADIVYIVMKPLEWLFIACLYMFDAHPENRIAVQYSDYKK